MSTVVQATCPGCKNVLRIPADWLQQSIKCKHCGLVMQARPSATAKRPAAAAPATKPAPAARPAPPPPLPVQPVAAPVAPVPVAVPAAVPIMQAAVAAPAVAMPYAAAPVDNGSPFGSLDGQEDESPAARRRRRRRSNPWKGPLVFLAVISVAGGITYALWPHIRDALASNTPSKEQEREKQVAQKEVTKKEKQPVAKMNDDEEDEPRPQPKKKTTPKGKRPPFRAKKGRDDPSFEPVVETKGPAFPRRALIISVHNYLYANPTQPGLPVAGARNVHTLKDRLANTLRIPFNQVAHLSDAAGRGQARPPIKSVIEKTVTEFLDSSRAQDRIMLYFVGHVTEAGDQVCFVPIEGELDNAATLIPLKWFYDKLAACKARQKVFVVDGCHFSPTNGAERPGADKMSAKIDAALKAPPAGVQVWSSCVAEQRSYETEDAPMGAFLDALYVTLEKGIQGRIQKPDDAFPLEQLMAGVQQNMKRELDPLKLEQTPRVVGDMPESGAAYDKTEAAPPPPVLASLPVGAGDVAKIRRTIQGVLDEIGAPPVKPGREDTGLKFDLLPPFSEKALEKYAADNPDVKSKVRGAVEQARAVLWAVNVYPPPQTISGEVGKVKSALRGVNLSVLKDGYRANPNENLLKTQVFNDQREVAKIFGQLDEAYEKLMEAKEDRGAETKRWQVNYDYTVARVEAQIAFIYEYQSMLGQMRKELPPRDAKIHNGWRLAAQPRLSGDAKGKKMAQNSLKGLDKIIKDHAGTPWEILAKREKLTALGLEWQPTR